MRADLEPGELFPKGSVPVQKNTPASFAARALTDFDRFAHEVRGCSPDMRWIAVETLGDYDTPREHASFRLVMAVPPSSVIKSGPRKGEINWRRRDKSRDRELIVSFKDLDAFTAKRKVPADLQAPGAGVTDRG